MKKIRAMLEKEGREWHWRSKFGLEKIQISNSNVTKSLRSLFLDCLD